MLPHPAWAFTHGPPACQGRLQEWASHRYGCGMCSRLLTRPVTLGCGQAGACGGNVTVRVTVTKLTKLTNVTKQIMTKVTKVTVRVGVTVDVTDGRAWRCAIARQGRVMLAGCPVASSHRVPWSASAVPCHHLMTVPAPALLMHGPSPPLTRAPLSPTVCQLCLEGYLRRMGLPPPGDEGGAVGVLGAPCPLHARDCVAPDIVAPPRVSIVLQNNIRRRFPAQYQVRPRVVAS
jgi:hypothetical protein